MQATRSLFSDHGKPPNYLLKQTGYPRRSWSEGDHYIRQPAVAVVIKALWDVVTADVVWLG